MSKLKPCSVEGCPCYVFSRGYCKRHYKKFIERPRKKQLMMQIRAEEKKVSSNKVEIKKKDETGKVKVKKYTHKELSTLFMTPLSNKKDFKNFLKFFFGIHLPDQCVSRFADSNPFDALWEVYDICTNKNNPNDINEMIFLAARGAGKTLSMAIAELMIALHDQRDVVHVGAILAQAKRCYEYQQRFLLSDKIKAIVSPPKATEDEKILLSSTMERSKFNANGERVTIEVLPCTLKSLNGPHVPLVIVDEIDTLSGEGRVAFKEISGMLDTKRGKRPFRVNISTRKSRYGLMETQISEAEKLGKTIRRWTALEFTERCPDSRSGTTPTICYVSIDDGSAIAAEDWNRIPESKKREYEEVEVFDKCILCPIVAWCRGDAKKQQSKSPMLKTIRELAAKVLSEGPDWTSAQLFNLRPSVEGIVFKEFDPRVHVKTWNQMWETLVGSPFPGTCTHDIFVAKCLSMKLSSYGSCDFGWSSPNTLVVVFVDSRENVYVVRCDGQSHISHPAWIHHIRYKWHPIYRTHLYFPDTADPGDGAEMRRLGLPVSNNEAKDLILTGIQVIKKWLRVPGTRDSKLLIAEETCKPLIQDFTLYHYKTDSAGQITEHPDDDNDHWLDPLRYIMQNLFGKSQIVLSSSGIDFDMSTIVDATGSFRKVPTAEEYAAVKGLPFNAEVNTVNIGKIGRLSELDEDEAETTDGGFIWMF